MMKSYVTMLQGLYTAIFRDLAVQFPSIHKELIRDHTRLFSTIEARGLSFLTIDLPEQGKHFDRCLSAQRLTHFPGPNSGSWKKGGIVPKLFRGLLLRVFDLDGSLRIDADPASIRSLRQLYYAAKKVKMECSDERIWKSISSFVRIDESLRVPSLPWTDNELPQRASEPLHLGDVLAHCGTALPLFDVHHDRRTSEDRLSSSIGIDFLSHVQLVADYVVNSFGEFNPLDWRAKHGPGAVSDRSMGGVYSKYSFPNWPEKLESAFPSSEFAYANLGDWAADSVAGDQCGLSPHEPPSRLIAVPKTQKTPRLIASEPTAHQWCQQMLLDYLATKIRTGLLSHTVHLCDQSENQTAASLASMLGSHATVDLSDASDRLSCWTIERMFRANTSLLHALHASRTRWVRNSIDKKSPEYIVLKKFACMGSACTFPVQSIVFAICCIASVLHARNIPVSRNSILQIGKEVRVFGDDLIIPIDGMELLQGLLDYLQLKVNPYKTHQTGKFRESCGLDVYDGNDVTPVYSSTHPERARPESIISCVEVCNNFFSKGYYHVAEWMKSTVTRVVPFGIPHVAIGSGAFGWRQGYAGDVWPHKLRWNENLHRLEARVLRVKTRSTKLPDHSPRSLLQYFTEDPEPTVMWASGVTTGRPSIKLVRSWESVEALGLLR